MYLSLFKTESRTTTQIPSRSYPLLFCGDTNRKERPQIHTSKDQGFELHFTKTEPISQSIVTWFQIIYKNVEKWKLS